MTYFRSNHLPNPMPPFRALLLLALLLPFSACQIAGPDDPPESNIEGHKARFEARYGTSYSFSLTRGCFCINGGELLLVQVVDGQVTAAMRTSDHADLPADQLEWLETMDEIFDMIQQAEQSAHHLEVTWSDFGYPAEFYIDWIEGVADDEMGMTISYVAAGVSVWD